MSTDITLTHLGHSCVLVELSRAGGTTRLLLDPGNLTPALDVGRVDAVLVTHGHPDHIDDAQLARLTAAGRIPLYGPADLAGQIRSLDVEFTPMETGSFNIAGVAVTATLSQHETLYPGIELPVNLGYHIGGRVFAPGDALTVPDTAVEILLTPLAGPWMKVSEGIDFVRAVQPTSVVPIHDAGLAPAHRSLHRALLTSFAPAQTTVTVLDAGGHVTL